VLHKVSANFIKCLQNTRPETLGASLYTVDSASLKTLRHCIILTQLDYCDSVLCGLPESTLLP